MNKYAKPSIVTTKIIEIEPHPSPLLTELHLDHQNMYTKPPHLIEILCSKLTLYSIRRNLYRGH